MTIGIGFARRARPVPGAVLPLGPLGPGGPAARSPAATHRRRWVMLAIMAVAAARLPRDSRTHQHVIMAAILLAAAAGFARDSQARMAKWDKRRNLRYLRSLKSGQS